MPPTSTSPPRAGASGLVLPPRRLWIYTNFDCNLACTYCLSSSSPRAPRRVLPLDDYRRLIDEATGAGCGEFFLTGGEPFLLPDILDRLRYAAERRPTTVLTNAMLLNERRVTGLRALRCLPLTLQVSLDGHRRELHDTYRGAGSWQRTVSAIRALLAHGFRVTVGATETPANSPFLDELRGFVVALGIPEDGFFLRPLTKRGFSREGIELQSEQVVPELTVTVDGVYWHPQTAGEAMLLSRSIFPLRDALALMDVSFQVLTANGPLPQRYRCA